MVIETEIATKIETGGRSGGQIEGLIGRQRQRGRGKDTAKQEQKFRGSFVRKPLKGAQRL